MSGRSEPASAHPAADERGGRVESSRLVDFASPLFNFRDVGGLATTDGGEVRRGVLFRSDTLTALGEADRERFAQLGVHTVIDLRHPVELERHGRAPAWCCEDWHNVPLNNPVWRAEDYSPEAGVVAFLLARYHETAEHAAADIARAVELIATAEGPTVVHCWGGRDRTGVVIALVLELAGVSDADIAADYELTEQGMARYLDWQRQHRPDKGPLQPYLASTPAEVMRTFLAQLRDRHGSVRAYLTGSGLAEEDIDALRSRLRE
ncbi:tyrosine-protein phosphatase [Catellatospora citrea]|uniref:Putative phosphotyrosine protein phosphatase n=1 Tax=Catellatospora citrea TaxID=53366 RepID=A0A8J3K9I2_9ACTN|nr:tyrosine-protein phosphatase [Catellatospora citrea]RKE07282.1 protein-tyrosine phosphatase [Catellatospora citrea]GIF95437.1 putative phosphotyrosine protein phosphatase [Catellatospora citrea]